MTFWVEFKPILVEMTLIIFKARHQTSRVIVKFQRVS